MKRTLTTIMSISILAFTLSFASCDFMAGMAAGAAYGLANTAYYYPSYSYTPNFGGTTSSSSNSSKSSSIDKELKTESDGFQWYQLRQDWTYYGAESTNGTTLIPLSRKYTFICYQISGGGWFCVDKGDKDAGVCDKSGKEIVAPGRYDNAYYRNEDGFVYVAVDKNGKEGACDRNGREIIAPKYNSVIYYNNHFSCDDGYYTKEGKPESTIASSNSTSSSSSSSTASSSSSSSSATSGSGNEKRLLYRGRYTETDHTWPAGNSMYAFSPIRQIEIYEDKIEVYSILGDGTIDYDKSISPIPFRSIQNGKRIYRTSGLFIDITLAVDGNFNISCSDTSGASYRFIKDSSSSPMPQGGNYSGGTGINNSGNAGSGNNGNKSGTSGNPVQPHQITESCPICHGSGKCNTCNGRHWYYGYSGNQITCPNCKPDGRCTHCGGSGKVTKTKYY